MKGDEGDGRPDHHHDLALANLGGETLQDLKIPERLLEIFNL